MIVVCLNWDILRWSFAGAPLFRASESQSLHNDYFGDYFTSCIEDFINNLTIICPELNIVKLRELEAPSENGVDLKLGIV